MNQDFEVVTTLYQAMINRLKKMDEKQLLELFHDLEDLAVVERIADCAYHFVENYEEIEETAPNEHFEADCAMRNSDLADEQKRGY